MKWHITSLFFTKLDDFLPFAIYMVELSLHNKKLGFLLIHKSWKMEIRFFQSLNHVYFYLKAQFLITSGYYIVPCPSIALWFLSRRDFFEKIFLLRRFISRIFISRQFFWEDLFQDDISFKNNSFDIRGFFQEGLSEKISY